jgi:hypothetical protein
MSKAAQIFSEQDWSENHREALINAFSDEKLIDIADRVETEFLDLLMSVSRYAWESLSDTPEKRRELRLALIQERNEREEIGKKISLLEDIPKKWRIELIDLLYSSNTPPVDYTVSEQQELPAHKRVPELVVVTYFYLNHALAGRADANRDSSIDSTLFEEPWIKHIMGYIDANDFSLDRLPGFERIEENFWFILKPYESSENLNDLAERAALVLHKYIINDRVFLDSDLVKSCIEHISLYRFPDKQLQQLPDTREKRQEIASKIFLAEDYPKYWREALINGLTDEVLESYFDKLESQFESDLEEFNDYSSDELGIKSIEFDFSAFKIHSFPLVNELILVLEFFFLKYHIEGEGRWGPKVLGDTDDFKQEWLNELESEVFDMTEHFMEGHSELYYLYDTEKLITDILIQEKRSNLSREYEKSEWNELVFDDIKEYSIKSLKSFALNKRIRVDIDEVRKSVLKINHWLANDIEVLDEVTEKHEAISNKIKNYEDEMTYSPWEAVKEINEDELSHLPEAVKRAIIKARLQRDLDIVKGRLQRELKDNSNQDSE